MKRHTQMSAVHSAGNQPDVSKDENTQIRDLPNLIGIFGHPKHKPANQ
jgi:hypothetical protein